MPGSKQVRLFLVSLCMSFIFFFLFVYLFPFPQENKTEIFSRFLPWVAVRTSLYTPYKYWWPLGLLVIPVFTYCVWYLLALWQKTPLKAKQYLDDIREDMPQFSPIEIGMVCAFILFFSRKFFLQFLLSIFLQLSSRQFYCRSYQRCLSRKTSSCRCEGPIWIPQHIASIVCI